MRIDRDSERNISQILTNVRQQSSDPGYSGSYSEASGSCMASQHGSTSASDWFEKEDDKDMGYMEEGQQPSDPPHPPQPYGFEHPARAGSSRGPSDARFSGPTTTTPNNRDLVDTGIPLPQPGVGLPPPGLVGGALPPPGLMGGASGLAGGATPRGSPEMDKRLLDELLEARNTNQRYKKMLVRKKNVGTQLAFDCPHCNYCAQKIMK